MIKLLALEIEEFRGIRHLKLDLGGKSFVVHGPNGSGKSGVVDAIGFVLSGTISRLQGAGTSGISLAKHGPHVHRRDDPAAAIVRLTFEDVESRQTGVIERCVKTPGTYKLTPDTMVLRAALAAVARHPELTLSRRDILKFILIEPGKRAAEVQTLLQLDALDTQRKALKAALTKLGRDSTTAAAALAAARQTVGRHLDLPVPQLVPDEVLRVINGTRAMLELPPLTEVTLETDFKQGVAEQAAEVTLDKLSALRDIDALQGALADGEGQRAATVASLANAAGALGADATVLDSLKLRAFVQAGLDVAIDDGVCPLCDTQWDSAELLLAHLREKIAQSEAAASLEAAVRAAASQVTAQLATLRGVVRPVGGLATKWGTADIQAAVQAFDDQIGDLHSQLTTTVAILGLRERLESGPLLPAPAALTPSLNELRGLINAKPDTTAKAQARQRLIVASERWASLRLARLHNDQAAMAHQLGRTMYDTFCAVADTALHKLYEEVEDRLSGFYQVINSDDESAFKAELEPSAGKLDLRVDFHGLGMFPPGAYHSEGHQDGMGVCLYLALVEQLLGSEFSFAVLDDVVMSVDSNHRRQFCELLKKEFPNVQFIITTHDVVWAKQMQSSGLISRRSQVHFQTWSVDAGPAADHGADFWGKIEADLASNDVNAAAHKLRRGMEAELPDLVENLRGKVTYRGDTKYELGELLGAVKGAYNGLLKRASSAANSWNNAAAKAQIQQLKDTFAAVQLAQSEENWAVNALIHYNAWAEMTKADFRPVVQAWREFIETFRCVNPACDSWIYVSGAPGREEAFRCSCGQFNLNLKPKG